MELRIKKVGIIGCGARGLHHIGFNIIKHQEQTGFVIAAVCNRSIESTEYAASELEKKYRDVGRDYSVKRSTDFRQILQDEEIDLVVITSHTDAHATHAVPAIESGKKVYLDKPIAVTMEDGILISEAEQRTGNRVLMGFTRRYEDSWKEMKRLLDSGKIGSLQMILLRSIIPYSRYMQGWHRKIEWSGGPLNDKCSHHFDVFRWMSGSDCQLVGAFGGRSKVFQHDPTAPARCCECDRECAYRRSEAMEESKEAVSSAFVQFRNDGDDRTIQDACVYSPENDVEDSGSINLRFSNGIVGNLFFTIFGPLAPDGETLELVGESGRLVLSRSDGQIRVFSNHGKESESYFAGGAYFDSSHYGSDVNLLLHMREFCDGAEPICNARDGMASLRMVKAARDSFGSAGDVQKLA